jgi:hypothetical protein
VSVVPQVNIALQAHLLSLVTVQLVTYAQVVRILQHLQVHLPSLIIQQATQVLAQLVIIVRMDQVIQDHVRLDTTKIRLDSQVARHARQDIIVLKEVL